MSNRSARTPGSIDGFVGARIALRRSALGLSQSAMGARLGVSFQQVQKYESGANRISASRLHAIASVLGASVADFFPQPGSPPLEEAPTSLHETAGLRLLTASADGRAVASAFPLIADRELRQALARIVVGLAGASPPVQDPA